MATLAGATIASTYATLIKLNANNDTLVAAASGNAVALRTGDNDTIPISLNTDRVGIGTSTPSSGLSIAGTSVLSEIHIDDHTGDTVSPSLRFRKSRNTAIAEHTAVEAVDKLGTIYFEGSNGTAFESGAAISAEADETFVVTDGGSAARQGANLAFHTTKIGVVPVLNERMRIDHNGNVGIGTVSPNTLLEVASAGSGATIALTTYNNSGDQYPTLQFRKADGVEANPGLVDDTEPLGAVNWYGHDSTNAFDLAASIKVVVDNSDGAYSDVGNVNPGSMHFYTQDSTTTDTTGIARLTIGACGNVGIGESGPDNQLHVTNADGVTKEVIKLQQLDIDEPFIMFAGTTAADQTRSLSTDTVVGALTGHILISVNATDYWIPFYAKN